MERHFLRQAVRMAVDNVRHGGGPFAALVVRDGIVVSRGVNCVTATNDPTAHAEIVAIREACRALGTFRLSACDVYSSCEPCPMCLGALHWARPARVIFAATREDAAAAGFDDSLIYRQIALPPSERGIPMLRLVDDESTLPFEAWVGKSDRAAY